MTAAPHVPSKAWYLLSPLLFLVAGIGGVIYVVTTIASVYSGGTRVLGPGEVACLFDGEGKQVIWLHKRTKYKGELYHCNGEPPLGISYEVIDVASGRALTVSPYLGKIRPADSDVSCSMASFQVPASGTYQVKIIGAFTPRVFSIAPPVVPRLIIPVLGGGVLVAFGWVIGPGIALMVFIRRKNALEAADNEGS